MVGIMNGMIGRAGVRSLGSPMVPTAGYLRDTRSGVIASRPAVLRESRDEIRIAWRRAAALAQDVMQNSGRLKGAADQVLADTVGVELQLRPKPNLSKLGYDEQEAREFVSLVKDWWKKWAWNPAECDLRGKLTVPQMVDVGLRWDMAYGEITGIMSYMPSTVRRRYGIRTGTKVCMVPPTRLVQDTDEFSGLFQGVRHDENGRATHYRFSERVNGYDMPQDYPAQDRSGRRVVMHIFDPMDATDVRGISKLAPGIRKHLQHEMLEDITMQQGFLQTVYAIALTSPSPSVEAFEAIEALKETGSAEAANAVAGDFMAYFAGAMERAQKGKIHVSGEPQISHLAPGEELELKNIAVPGDNYLPFSASLSRDTARAIGITYGGLTMDHTDATYSSVRMETASIWPVVMRRRERSAAPLCQSIYESALDEAIGEGRIPIKGGYEAFRANRDDVCWAQWQGPPKPTADDLKSAKAQSERLENGTSSTSIECAEAGIDEDELFEDRLRTHRRYLEEGMRSPYEPRAGRDRTDEADPKKREAAA
ncbi:phage portal protein [Oricola indica]|uniref:phage portal protein n=1 Tax=Oricola indica TaxID=2872591 RepID=UPI001CBE3778|nr:phage portal protein [Oricola indica]